MTDPTSILRDCATDLSENGFTELAEQVEVLGRSAARTWVGVADAAKLAGVSEQTIKHWIMRGVIVSRQAGKGTRHQIDRASVISTIERRAEIDRARIAFADPTRAAAYVSGLDPETIERLGGV